MTSPAFDFSAAEPAASPLAASMPCNIEAEQALLGTLLYDNAAYERLIDKLQARHFYEPFHQRLFAIMEEHIRRGQLAEPILLADRFKARCGVRGAGRPTLSSRPRGPRAPRRPTPRTTPAPSTIWRCGAT